MLSAFVLEMWTGWIKVFHFTKKKLNGFRAKQHIKLKKYKQNEMLLFRLCWKSLCACAPHNTIQLVFQTCSTGKQEPCCEQTQHDCSANWFLRHRPTAGLISLANSGEQTVGKGPLSFLLCPILTYSVMNTLPWWIVFFFFIPQIVQ